MSSADETKRLIYCVDVEGEKHPCTVDKLERRPAAYALVFRGDEMLIIKTKYGLTFPGGAIEIDESHETALAREVFEETGIHIRVDNVSSVGTSYWYNRGKYHQSLSIFCICEYISGEPVNTHLSEDERLHWECEPGWISIETAYKQGFAFTGDWRAALKAARHIPY